MLFIPIFWFVYIYQFIFPTCSRTFAKLWISWKRLVSLWKYYHSINVENGGTESRVNLCHLKQNLRLLFKKNCCDNLICQVITIRCLKMQGFVFYQQLLYNETLIQRNTIAVKFQGASLRNTKISTERDKILIWDNILHLL